MASGVEKLAPSALNYTWAKKMGFETVSPRWRELSYELCLDATNAMANSTGYFPAWDALLGKRFDKQITTSVPITIIFGDSDHTLPQKTCQERSLAPTHAKWVVLPQTGHVPMWDSPNALNIDVQGDYFTADISALDKSKSYAVYCRSGKRSVLASEVMEQIGIVNVYNLTGGIMEWQESGRDTVN